MKNETTISLKILFLRDMLRNGFIDEGIFNKAIKILSAEADSICEDKVRNSQICGQMTMLEKFKEVLA